MDDGSCAFIFWPLLVSTISFPPKLSEAHCGVLPGKQESFGSKTEKTGQEQGESEHALEIAMMIPSSVEIHALGSLQKLYNHSIKC